MELPEPIERINKLLLENFGKHDDGQAIWRVVWSEDQFEHRLGDYDDYDRSGNFLRSVREVRYVPKYRQWIPEKYVLERLVVIPVANLPELPAASKLSYEPIFPFEDKNGNALPPKFQACKFVIDTIYAAMNENHNLAKYKDTITMESEAADKEKRIKEYEEILFGDESGLKGTTHNASGNSIIVP